MFDEKRTEAINIRIRPSLRGAIEVDRQSKGQSLVEWVERAASAALKIDPARPPDLQTALASLARAAGFELLPKPGEAREPAG